MIGEGEGLKFEGCDFGEGLTDVSCGRDINKSVFDVFGKLARLLLVF